MDENKLVETTLQKTMTGFGGFGAFDFGGTGPPPNFNMNFN